MSASSALLAHPNIRCARCSRFALDGLFSFSTKPLQAAVTLGLASAGFAMLRILYALALRVFSSVWVEGWTALMIAVLFMGGVQLVSLGIMGEYIGRIYNEVKRRPLYIVGEKVGFDGPPAPTRARRGQGSRCIRSRMTRLTPEASPSSQSASASPACSSGSSPSHDQRARAGGRARRRPSRLDRAWRSRFPLRLLLPHRALASHQR